MKAYKYRIYPTKMQAMAIDKTIEACRQLYNELLAQKKDTYEKDGTKLSRKNLYSQVKGNKELHSQVSQNVADRVDKAYRNFFARVKRGERKKGFPRFKKYHRACGSITLPQITNQKKISKKTYFPKIGWLNVKYHRPITGTPKMLTIKKAQSGKYFATICCEDATNEPIKTTSKEIGIDLGLNHFAATSDGEFFEHPKPLKVLATKRKQLARQFGKTKKRSNNRTKASMKLARLDEKIANIRNDFGWKLCQMLIRKYGTIYAEDLNIKGMQKNHHLAGAITDVSWADFLQKLSYKAESAGGKVVKVNPRNTSQICSECGEIVEKNLDIRTHNCSYCHLEIDRDTNAARNILTIGKIGLEQPKSSLKEMKPLSLAKAIRQASSMKQEAPCGSWV